MSLVTSVNTQPRSLASLPIPASPGLPLPDAAGAPRRWDTDVGYIAGNLVSYAMPTFETGYLCLATETIPPSISAPAPFFQAVPGGPISVRPGWNVMGSGEPFWDISTTYFPGDVVSYTETSAEPQLFMCLINSVGVAPTPNATSLNWKLMTSGAQSALTAGTGISIVSGVISTALVEGTGIDISGATISSALLAGTGIDISGAVVSSALVAGTGVDISGAVVSAKLEEGSNIVITTGGANSSRISVSFFSNTIDISAGGFKELPDVGTSGAEVISVTPLTNTISALAPSTSYWVEYDPVAFQWNLHYYTLTSDPDLAATFQYTVLT